MSVKRFENDEKELVAVLYIKENGDLHEDSWLCPDGWKEPPK